MPEGQRTLSKSATPKHAERWERTQRVFEIFIGSSHGQPRVTGATSTSVDQKGLVGAQVQHKTLIL
jgi:hypothetical protein